MSNKVALSAFNFTTDDAALNWRRRVYREGGTVSDARLTLVTTLVDGLQADGVWTKLDRLWLWAAEAQTAGLVDLVGGSLATIVGAPTFTANRGFAGQDLLVPTAYINTNYNPSTSAKYAQNSAHISCWSVDNPTVSNGGVNVGNGDVETNALNYIAVTFSSSNIFTAVNGPIGGDAQGSTSDKTGHWLANRDASNSNNLFHNSSSFSTAGGTSAAVVNAPFFTLASNKGLLVAQYGHPSQQAMLSFGASFTSGEVTSFYNRLRTYMTAVGVP